MDDYSQISIPWEGSSDFPVYPLVIGLDFHSCAISSLAADGRSWLSYHTDCPARYPFILLGREKQLRLSALLKGTNMPTNMVVPMVFEPVTLGSRVKQLINSAITDK
eukprot:GHVR01120283.1.p1 GENE.GHVR01120283.1~~GHVR01120283.1.p1  ORF type:complete len:107 (-),score=1.62 GHVR01120283.1:227-547(-)